jgi:NADPH:quinone reductase-like Zn-dependent oxidoreductase
MKRASPPRWRRVLRRLVQLGAALVILAFLALVVAYAMSDNDCDELLAAVPVHPMKAIVYCDYGSPDVLQLRTVEKPVPADNQVLVRVRAAAVNPFDWHFMRGTPYIMRLSGTGLRKPKDVRLGVDFAGTVEAVGKDVTTLEPGDEVFGGRSGAFAEYVCVSEARVARKPASITFEQAAAVPIAGLTALQALRDRGRVRPGHKVLINGASGGVGTFAVQIAKTLGADVTGVCSTRNVDLVRSLGADRVVDYTREDFAKSDQQYDVIMDNVGNRSLSEFRRVLSPTGRYVLIGGGGPQDHKWLGPLGRLLGAALVSQFASQDMGMFISSMKQDDLVTLGELMQAGKVTPIIDRRYALSEAAEAIRYLEKGRARGKVILTLD